MWDVAKEKKKSIAQPSYRVKRLKANFPIQFKKQSLEGFWMSTLMHYRDVYLPITADIRQNLKGMFSISAAMRTVERQKYELQDAPSSCRRFMKTVFFRCCRWAAFQFLFFANLFWIQTPIWWDWIFEADVMEWDGYIFAFYFYIMHFCPVCVPMWAPLHPHAELHQELPRDSYSCMSKGQFKLDIGNLFFSARLVRQC